MKTSTLTKLTLSLFLFSSIIQAQDTFSIVAVDSVTGEVGSAGASCVDLYQTTITDDSFLGVIVPDVGAINTQAYYIPANQTNATNRMLAGDTPDQIISWLVVNDVQSAPQFRQYGVVSLNGGSPLSAAHTGSSTDDYKNHIIGPNYAIQGNILLGQEVLDSMEARFLAEPGGLKCKLMAAMQGASMIGADTRCTSNGSSSLFAFIKVAQPTDTQGNPSFVLSVRTHDNDGIEPIDSLQALFDASGACSADLEELNGREFITISPNPTSEFVHFENNLIEGTIIQIEVIDVSGRIITTFELSKDNLLDVREYQAGAYLLRFDVDGISRTKRFVVE